MICDAHCDLPTKVLDENQSIFLNDCHWSIHKAKSDFVQIFAHWVDAEAVDNPFLRVNKMISAFLHEIHRYPGKIAVCTTGDDILKNTSCHKIAAFLSIEGGEALCGNLKNLSYFHKKGIRFLTLTWNHENDLGYGVGEGVPDKGLKPFGVQVVKEMERLKMVVDVSHLSQRGFWDVADCAIRPFIASHSNAYAVSPHPRNLTDEQIRFLIKSKGYIGLNFYPYFLNGTSQADFSDIVRHIDHFLALGAQDILGFGCDFDGIDSTPKGIPDISGYQYFMEYLQKLNYNDEIIAKITSKNFIDAMFRILK